MPKQDPTSLARAFDRFAASGYKETLLSDALYRALSVSFGFIAHFDRRGFYAARFSTWGDRVDTLQSMTCPADRTRTPVEVALHDVVVNRDLLAAAISERETETERRERAELARLRAKYG